MVLIFLNVFLRQLHLTLSSIPVVATKVPSYSKCNDLHKYCKAVKNYCNMFELHNPDLKFKDIQRSESFIYHLDSPNYSRAKENSVNRLAEHERNHPKSDQPPNDIILGNLPAFVQTMQTQLEQTHVSPPSRSNPSSSSEQQSSSSRSIHNPHVNQVLECVNNNSPISDSISVNPCVNFVSRQHSGHNNSNDTHRPRNNSSTRPFTGRFKGKCRACGMANHHASNCCFLRKLKQCLDYLKNHPNYANDVRADHK